MLTCCANEVDDAKCIVLPVHIVESGVTDGVLRLQAGVVFQEALQDHPVVEVSAGTEHKHVSLIRVLCVPASPASHLQRSLNICSSLHTIAARVEIRERQIQPGDGVTPNHELAVPTTAACSGGVKSRVAFISACRRKHRRRGGFGGAWGLFTHGRSTIFSKLRVW
jgi:hypothetical protein